jgi:NADH dehydrogenase [ubiquinone] 1 alpha subcomplex assembly factor 7
MATNQQKRAAAAATEKKRENKEKETPSYPPPSMVMPSNTLIRTDLKEHFEWKDSQRPSFDPQKPPAFEADPSGIVQRDLTETMIDLSEIYDSRLHTSLDDDGSYEVATPLSRELEAYIAVRSAPMTVAEYMRQALTHPLHGYYTNPTSNEGDEWDDDDAWDDETTSAHDFIIGSKGDFVTAPEVSQVFGECICVWFITQWQEQGKPKELQIVEVGPGKGTLISDIMRSALNVFTDFGDSIRKIHLVEASPAMRMEQQRKLQALSSDTVEFVFQDGQDSVFGNERPVSPPQEKSNETKSGDKRKIDVVWHDSFSSVMRESSDGTTALPTLVLCQEFIDALPVHVFEKTNDGWRERMIDINSRDEDAENGDEKGKVQSADTKEKLPRLRYVLSPNVTPALRTLLNVNDAGVMENDEAEVGAICEVCPEGILLSQDIAQLLSKNGGSALIVDYGQDGSTDSIRAFSRHQQVHVLRRPGEVDVTADVDFAALRHAVNAKAESHGLHAHGPVTQGKFLMAMGAAERVSNLIEDENTSDEQAEDLYSALERLVLPEQMGERYKVMAIAKKKDGIFSPPGFN